MNRRYRDMCKYANTSVVRVSTTAHVSTIKKVLATKIATPQISVPKTEFDKKLWVRDGSDNPVAKK